MVRPLGWTVVGTVIAYFVLGGKSYYGLPSVLFALAVGAIPFERWATRRRLWTVGVAYVAVSLLLLPITLPVLPEKTADRLGVIGARGDYQDEIGWPGLVHTVEHHTTGIDVVIAHNYGEAGALQVLGYHLPPIASAHVSFRYWRPSVKGRQALLVNFTRTDAAGLCHNYRLVARITMPIDNEERGSPIARCTLNKSLTAAWPQLIANSFK
jgi:hypothetical protein